MRVIGIIGAMTVEIEMIKESLSTFTEENYAGFHFYVTKYKNLDLILVSCGGGKVNAACCTQILIDKFHVNKIINTGIAGSLNPNVKLCDTVISEDLTYHDVRKVQMKTCFPFKEYFKADNNLKELAIEVFNSSIFEGHNYHVGRIVTGDAFISDSNLKSSIIEQYYPYCVEMEGAAIAHVSEINEVPFLVIRSISDNADNEADIDYDKFEKIAANNSAKLVLGLLDLLNDNL